MKKRIKKTIQGAGILAWATILWYIASPKIGHISYKTQKKLIENLDIKGTLKTDSLYLHEDQETQIILDFMAGYGEKKELERHLGKYGEELIWFGRRYQSPDPALYQAIRQLHTKYGNPKITFGEPSDYKNFATGQIESERANYDYIDNTINIRDLQSEKLQVREPFFNDPANWMHTLNKIWYISKHTDNPQDRQHSLLNNWVAELGHAQGNHEKWTIKFYIDAGLQGIKTYRPDSFNVEWLNKAYDKLYHIPGNEEYEAHKIREPQLIQEFIQTYIQYSDTNDPNVQYKIAKLYMGYFDSRSNIKEGNKRLQKAIKNNSEPALIIQATNCKAEYLKKLHSQDYDRSYTNMHPDSVRVKIQEENDTLQRLAQEAITLYTQLSKKKIQYVYDIMMLYKYQEDIQNYEKRLYILDKNRKTYRSQDNSSKDTDLGTYYLILSDMYARDLNTQKAKEMHDKAHQIGINREIYYPWHR